MRVIVVPGNMDPVDVRSALRQQIGAARRALRRKGALSDDAVHSARKELKRARASLRLLRDAIGDSHYARENARLRDAARPLAPMRDAKVTLEAAGRLLVRDGKVRRRAGLLRLRRELRADQRRARREVRESGVLAEIERSLAEAARGAEHWRLPRNGAPVLRAGLARIYRRGRKALAAAESEATDENLHESRKQVKYLEKAMEVLEPAKPRRIAKLIERAEAVADLLGDDHDLAVLQGRLTALRADSHQVPKALLSHIERRRRKLQRKALKQGSRLYQRKTGAFVDRLE